MNDNTNRKKKNVVMGAMFKKKKKRVLGIMSYILNE